MYEGIVMIREFREDDLNFIMQIWLESNLDAHSFIGEKYWKDNYGAVSDMIPSAEVYIFEDEDGIEGFIGLMDNYIAGLFVNKAKRSMGMGKQLLDFVKGRKDELFLDVFVKNEKAVRFYTREGFSIQNRNLNSDTQEEEYSICYKKREFIAYHVVTERPMYVGQHIVFDEEHHNGVWKRVQGKLDVVNEIYKSPEKYQDLELEHHVSVALRELALEKIRKSKYLKYPSRLACLYVSKTYEEAENWFDFFTSIGRPTFQIVKLHIKGNAFLGNATKCFDGRIYENENLDLAEKYWQNKENASGEKPIVEMLVDGDIEVIDILKERIS